MSLLHMKKRLGLSPAWLSTPNGYVQHPLTPPSSVCDPEESDHDMEVDHAGHGQFTGSQYSRIKVILV